MTWTEQAPAFVGAFIAISAIFVLPGAGLLWLARVRGLLAWAMGPVLSALFYGTTAVVLDMAGLSWGVPAVLVAAVPAALVAVLLGWWRRCDPPMCSEAVPKVVTRAAWVGAILAGTLVIVGVCWGITDLAAPLQVRDAIVHLNGLEMVREQGNATMFGALDAVVSIPGSGAFYPTLWHGALALVPFGSAGVVSNAAMLVVATVLWPLAMVALTRAVLPAQPWAVVIVATLSTSFSFFPFGQLVLSAQWPNGLGGATIPAVLAATVLWIRSWNDRTESAHDRRRRALSGAVVLVAALGGMALVHPNTLFSYLVFAGPLLLAVAWRTWSARPRSRRDVTWLVAIALGVAALATVAARVTGLDHVLANVMGYQQILADRPYTFTVSRLLADTTLVSAPGNVVLSALVLTGVVVLLRERRLRWVVLAWGLTIVLAALAGGPENPLRGITGFWYKHVFRLEALYPITALLLTAVGTIWWAQWLHTRWATGRGDEPARGVGRVLGSPARAGATLVAAAFLSSAAIGVPAMADRTAGVYDPDQLGRRLLASEDDRRMLDRLDELVPADAVVIGDPNAGAVLISSYGGRTPVYYRIGADWLSPDQRLLALHFDAIAADPTICEAIARLGVDYLYLNTATVDQSWPDNSATRALRDVDTSTGFELVAREGAVELYRITACD